MMKTSAKVLATMSACALCAVMAGGAAYAVTPNDDQNAPQSIEASQSMENAYTSTDRLVEICGLD